MFDALKKVEIIIESIKVHKIIRIADKLDLPGYTVIPDVSGKGAHGVHDAHEVSDVLHNSYVIIVCSEKKMEQLTQALVPLLKKYEGVCFVSDVQKLVVN